MSPNHFPILGSFSEAPVPFPLSLILELPAERWEKQKTLKSALPPLLSDLWEIQPVVERDAFFFYYGEEFLRWCASLGATVTLSVPLSTLTEERIKVAVANSLHRLTLVLDSAPGEANAPRGAWAGIEKAVDGIRQIQEQYRTKLPQLRLEAAAPFLVEAIRSAAGLGIGEVIVGKPPALPPDLIDEASALAEAAGVNLNLGMDIGGLITRARPAAADLNCGRAVAGVPNSSSGHRPDRGGDAAPTMGSRRGAAAPCLSTGRRVKDWLKKRLYRSYPPERFVDASTLKPGSERRKACLFPWNRTVIGRELEVRVCPVSKSRMGDLSREPFEKIWNNPAYAIFRKRLLSPDPPEECRRCAARGWFVPHELADWLWMGINDQFGVNLGPGWHEPEPGLPYRWSRREAVFKLRNPGKKRLALILHLPAGKLRQSGEVWIGRVKAGDFHLRRPGDSAWHFPLPPARPAGEELSVRLRCAREIIPRVVLGNDDRRRLGAAFKSAFLVD